MKRGNITEGMKKRNCLVFVLFENYIFDQESRYFYLTHNVILESIIWANGNNFEKKGVSLYSGSAFFRRQSYL